MEGVDGDEFVPIDRHDIGTMGDAAVVVAQQPDPPVPVVHMVFQKDAVVVDKQATAKDRLLIDECGQAPWAARKAPRRRRYAKVTLA